MSCKDIIVLVALFAIAAAVKLEAKPPHHHGHHHDDAVLFNPEVTSTNMPVDHPSTQDGQNDQEAVQDEYEADVPITGLKRFLERKSIPTNCDALNTPRYSCYNCYSYLVCKPEGGKIKACKDPYAPYCNNGVCSQTPSANCSN